jgi:hypothetical protein
MDSYLSCTEHKIKDIGDDDMTHSSKAQETNDNQKPKTTKETNEVSFHISHHLSISVQRDASCGQCPDSIYSIFLSH